MIPKVFTVFSIIILSCSAFRSPYAGKSPIGYPALTSTTTATTTTTVVPVDNRLAGDDSTTTTTTTTMRLPIEVLGDVDLYNRLLKLPVNEQPFWLINSQALEANRLNPKTYFQKDNTFIDSKNGKTIG